MFEPRVGFVLEAAFESEYTLAPCEDTLGDRSEALAGSTAVQPEASDKPAKVDFGSSAEDTDGGWDASAGEWVDFVALMVLSTAGMETRPEGSPAGRAEVVLEPVDVG